MATWFDCDPTKEVGLRREIETVTAGKALPWPAEHGAPRKRIKSGLGMLDRCRYGPRGYVPTKNRYCLIAGTPVPVRASARLTLGAYGGDKRSVTVPPGSKGPG